MLRIIAADNHPIVLRGLKETIRESLGDVLFEEVHKGYDVINRIHGHEYDLVLLDIALPDINGLEVLKEIRKKRPRLPVLVLSMHPDEHYAMRVIKAGGSGYLSKRATCEELVQAMRKVLSGKRYVNPAFAERIVLDFESKTEKQPHERLSDREFQVACMIGQGKTIKEITQELHLSMNTVRTYRARVLEKMGVRATNQLIHYAVKHALVE